MRECPTCGESFDSRRGLGVHHSAAHDELLPNRACAHCGEAFHSQHERKYCSEACRSAAVSFEGADNPTYGGGIESTTGDICGAEFEYYPSAKPGLYCESCVETERWRHDGDISGEKNPRWNGGEKELECDHRGGPVLSFRNPRRTRLLQRRLPVRVTLRGLHRRGPPQLEGRRRGQLREGWNRVRQMALERDDYRCVLCGTTREELGRNPDVHHVVPVRAFVEHPVTTERDAHSLENVVSLCVDCHRKAEFGHVSRGRLREVALAGTLPR